MNDKTMLRTGLIGSAIAVLCCLTPLLVVVVAGVGLSAIIGWLDYALFPLFFASLGITAQALWLRVGQPGSNPRRWIMVSVVGLSALLFWLQFHYAFRLSIGAILAVAFYGFWLSRNGATRRSDGSKT